MRGKIAGFALCAVWLLLAGCRSSESDSGNVDAGNDALQPGVAYSTAQIVPVASGELEYKTTHFPWQQYSNPAYPCGAQGSHGFMVLQSAEVTAYHDAVWVIMPGAGAGYYDSQFNYHGTESLNLELPSEQYLTLLDDFLAVDTVVGKRLLEGWKVVLVSGCDHDLYTGTGTDYPNNPYQAQATVDGLLATMAAVDFVSSRQSDSLVFLHGTSAGSVGAGAVTQAFYGRGVDLSGVILDGYLFSDKLDQVQANQCSFLHRADPTFEIAAVREKSGIYLSPPYYYQNQTGVFNRIPNLVAIGEFDGYCCGDLATVPEASAAGYNNNCRYAYSDIEADIRQRGRPDQVFYYAEGRGHVISKRPEAIQGVIENWLQTILANDPNRPWR